MLSSDGEMVEKSSLWSFLSLTVLEGTRHIVPCEEHLTEAKESGLPNWSCNRRQRQLSEE